MKNIKYFKYWYSYEFERCLKDYGYAIENVKGFSVSSRQLYHGNILIEYCIYFKDGEIEYFKVVYFSSFNEYHQCRLGFKGEKLLDWYQTSHIKHFKLSGEYVRE